MLLFPFLNVVFLKYYFIKILYFRCVISTMGSDEGTLGDIPMSPNSSILNMINELDMSLFDDANSLEERLAEMFSSQDFAVPFPHPNLELSVQTSGCYCSGSAHTAHFSCALSVGAIQALLAFPQKVLSLEQLSSHGMQHPILGELPPNDRTKEWVLQSQFTSENALESEMASVPLEVAAGPHSSSKEVSNTGVSVKHKLAEHKENKPPKKRREELQEACGISASVENHLPTCRNVKLNIDTFCDVPKISVEVENSFDKYGNPPLSSLTSRTVSTNVRFSNGKLVGTFQVR